MTGAFERLSGATWVIDEFDTRVDAWMYRYAGRCAVDALIRQLQEGDDTRRRRRLMRPRIRKAVAVCPRMRIIPRAQILRTAQSMVHGGVRCQECSHHRADWSGAIVSTPAR